MLNNHSLEEESFILAHGPKKDRMAKRPSKGKGLKPSQPGKGSQEEPEAGTQLLLPGHSP